MTPTDFVNKFLNHFGTPQVPDPKGLVADYTAAFEGTDPDVLRTASVRLIRAHKYRNWPTVGECTAVVAEVAAERNRGRERELRHIAVEAEPTPEQRARVGSLVSGFAASFAAKEQDRITPAMEDWERGVQPAWDHRMATSPVARFLAIPRKRRGV